MIQDVIPAVFGIPEKVRPIIGLPGEKIKLRFRAGQLAILYIRRLNGVEKWFLKDSGEYWEPLHLAGANVR